MSLGDYSKDYSSFLDHLKHRQKRKRQERFFYVFISSVGILAIIATVAPLIIWNLTTSKKFTGKAQQQPVPERLVIVKNPLLLGEIQVVKDADGFTYFTTSYNPQREVKSDETRPKEFYVSIPKLKIEKAKVKVDSLQFNQNIAHFPSTALPGEVGNSFITGHSSLPILNDPKDYKSIFTKLPSLEVGDEVLVEINGKTLNFVVQYTKIVDPKDTSVLTPISKTGHNLTLMTCVPPGTSTKRLVVVTSLI